MGDAATRSLHLERDAAIGEDLDAIEREGGTAAVAHEALASLVVVLGDAQIAFLGDGADWTLQECAACECELRAGFERGGLRPLVSAVFRGAASR